MKKPLIVLTPQNMPMEEPFHENYNYSNCFNSKGILRVGGIPIMPPYLSDEDAESIMEIADGLWMTGGADIDPAMYGEEKLEACGKLQPERDQSDLALLKAALKFKKPVFCVCRGSQLANVYFGGTLYQDMPSQRPGSLEHTVESYPEYSQEACHQVNIVEDSPLHELLGLDTLGVNTLHHQAVKDLAPCLRPMAFSTDGVLESWYMPGEEQWIRAYQWHPEMQEPNERNTKILKDFVDACVRYRDK